MAETTKKVATAKATAETKKTTAKKAPAAKTTATKTAETKPATKTAATKKSATTKASATKEVAATKTAKTASAKKVPVKEVKAEVKAEVKVKAPVAEVKTAPAKKEVQGPKVKVTLVRSTNGALIKQKRTIQALGLKKIRSSAILADNAATRGMIHVVRHMVTVEEVK